MRLLLALMVVCSVLSGCTTVGGSGDGPTFVTAREAQPAADRAALRWADDAVLAGASAFEMDAEARREARDELDDAREELREARDDGDIEADEYRNITDLLDVFDRIVDARDDAPGDGRAVVWFFTYYSEMEEEQYGLAVSKGKVVYTEDHGEAADEFDLDGTDEGLGEWVVDSSDAAEAANLGDPDYGPLCAAKNIITYSTLAQGEDGAVWYVGVEKQDDDRNDDEDEEDGPDEVYLAVDASTGALVQDEVLEEVQQLFQESGYTSGALAAMVQTSFSEFFEVQQDGHRSIAVEAYVNPAPPQPVLFTLIDPAGNRTELQLALGNPPTTTYVREYVLIETGAPAGVYAVEVDVELSAYSSYYISWCTDGIPITEGPFQESSCDYILQPEDGMDGTGETLSRFHRWLAAW